MKLLYLIHGDYLVLLSIQVELSQIPFDFFSPDGVGIEGVVGGCWGTYIDFIWVIVGCPGVGTI